MSAVVVIFALGLQCGADERRVQWAAWMRRRFDDVGRKTNNRCDGCVQPRFSAKSEQSGCNERLNTGDRASRPGCRDTATEVRNDSNMLNEQLAGIGGAIGRV